MTENDAEFTDELARSIDASLRRSFAPPADVELILERARAHDPGVANDEAGPLAVGRWASAKVAASLAAAAALVLFMLPGGGEDPEACIDEIQTALVPVGPLQSFDPEQEPAEVKRPDLEHLYSQVAACSGNLQMSCTQADDLGASLASNHDARVRLKPEADNLLHGPVSSAEWPTATILTGFPEGETAVLIAEREGVVTCCLDVQLPPESDLRIFTWSIDGLFLTEITPLAEPRLLSLFEAREIR